MTAKFVLDTSGYNATEEEIELEMKRHGLHYAKASELLRRSTPESRRKSRETFQRLEAEGRDFRELALSYKIK